MRHDNDGQVFVRHVSSESQLCVVRARDLMYIADSYVLVAVAVVVAVALLFFRSRARERQPLARQPLAIGERQPLARSHWRLGSDSHCSRVITCNGCPQPWPRANLTGVHAPGPAPNMERVRMAASDEFDFQH